MNNHVIYIVGFRWKKTWKIVEKLFFNKGLRRDWLLWVRLGVWIWQLLLEKACFSSGLPGAALAQLAAIVNPANKPTKVKWSLSWSRAWEIVEKLFLNKGLIRDWLLPRLCFFMFFVLLLFVLFKKNIFYFFVFSFHIATVMLLLMQVVAPGVFFGIAETFTAATCFCWVRPSSSSRSCGCLGCSSTIWV